jgi:putative membrane protein
MKKQLIYLLALIIVGVTACNSNPDPKQVAAADDKAKFDSTNMKSDALFAVNVADGGMLEIKAGELAQANAELPVVKNLGKMMVDDHSKLADQLKEIAMANNITLPDSLSDASVGKYKDLMKNKAGKDFDKAFTQMMIDDHTKTIKAFQDEAANGNNTALKDWANKTLPQLQSHLAMSDSAADVIKGEH